MLFCLTRQPRHGANACPVEWRHIQACRPELGTGQAVRSAPPQGRVLAWCFRDIPASAPAAQFDDGPCRRVTGRPFFWADPETLSELPRILIQLAAGVPTQLEDRET